MKHNSLVICTLAASMALFATACSDKPTDVAPTLTPGFAAGTPFNDAGACMGDNGVAANALPGNDLVDGLGAPEDFNCTANDIEIASATVTHVNGAPVNPGDAVTCSIGQPITVTMNAVIRQTASSARTDIGVWIATDGGNAETGQCRHYNLVNGVPGVSDLDNDSCGDMNSAAGTVGVQLGTFQLACVPKPGTDSLFVGACLGWTVPGSDRACPFNGTNPLDFRYGTLPNNKSKCNCEGFTLPIIINQDAWIRVAKVCQPSSVTGATFDLKVDGTTVVGPPSGDDAACGATTAWVKVGAGTSAAPGAPHSTSEVINSGNFISSSFACTELGGASVKTGSGTSSGTFTAMPNDSITCTYTNVKEAKIVIVKDAQPDNAQDFSFTTSGTGLAGFSLDDDADGTLSNTKVFSGLGTGSYSVTEGAVSGWTLTGLSCSSGGSGNVGTATASITLAAGDSVRCVFTNTKNGDITIIKDAQPNHAQDFAYTTTGAGLSGFSLDDDGDATLSNTKTFTGVAAGTYEITEGAVAGWALFDIVCTGSATSTKDIANRKVTIVVNPVGEGASCTFINQKDSKIVIEKDVQNPATDLEDFAFTTSGTGLSSFNLDDDADATLSNIKVFAGQLHGQVKTIIEGAEANFDNTSITCSTGGSGNTGTRTATIAAMQPGDSVKCTFVNQRKARLIIQKIVVGGSGTETFDFTRNGSSVGTIGNGGEINSGFTLGPATYKVCEAGVPVASFQVSATLTDGGNANPQPVSFLSDPEGDDFCVNIALAYGQTRTIVYTNQVPSGSTRTIGYWKNWSSCTKGKQWQKALADDNWDKTLDGNLGEIPNIGLLDLTGATEPNASPDCGKAVNLLSKSNINGLKMPGDPIYNMVAQLLGALLNKAAGSGSCAAAETAISGAQALLLAITPPFDGVASYKTTLTAQQASLANSYAGTLDRFNNGTLGGGCPTHAN